jgi:CRISPR-associated protein Csm4
MRLYKIIPRAPFHFGERGIGQEETADFPHSDTLFAALISVWRLMYDEETFESRAKGCVEYEGPPPFRISSAFPYIGGVTFLPRPAIPLMGAGGDRKRGKKVTYISRRRAEGLIHSDVPPSVDPEDTLMNGRLWVHPHEKAAIREALGLAERADLSSARAWSSADTEAMARVTVDRVTEASAVYYQGMVRFAEGCGFYLLAEVFDEGYEKPLEDGLRFLGEQGLGGRRSAGLGQFALQVEETELPEAPDRGHNYHWLLSLYHPTREEVQLGALDEARYKLVTRRGWIYSPDGMSQRRRAIRMLGEGGLLTRTVAGDVVDVAPAAGFPHPIWRSGIALTITTRRWRDA